MTIQDFKNSLQQSAAPKELDDVQQALWYDGKGNWDKAHAMIQDNNDSKSAWIHAYLHRKEGDTFNAQYWYTRAGKEMPQTTLQEEWENLVDVLVK